MTDNLHMRVFSHMEDIRRLEKDWQDLEARNGASFSFFQSAAWCLSWLETAYQPKKRFVTIEPLIYTLWQGDSLVFLLPMQRVRYFGIFCKMVFLSGKLAQYGGYLADGSLCAQQLLARFRSDMEESPCSQGLELSNIPRSTAFSSAFDEGQKRPNGNYASLIDLTLLEEGVSFEKSQSKRYRKNLTRFKNRFNSMGKLTFRRVTEPCEINATASLMLEWKKLWFEEKGIPGESSENLQLENLFTKLLKSQSNAFCFVLELDGKPIAAEIGFAEKSHYYAYYGAFDNEHGAYSPGNVLLVEQLEWMRNNGLHTYDLLANPAPYKDRLSNARVELTSVHAVTTKSLMRLPASLFLGLRERLKRGFSMLPQSVRRSSSALIRAFR